jgi:hypothetical protein
MTFGRTVHGQQENGATSVVSLDVGRIRIRVVKAAADLGRRTGSEQQAQKGQAWNAGIATYAWGGLAQRKNYRLS